MNDTMIKPSIKIKSTVKRYLADLLTPVSLYLRVRDQFTEPVLLESNDFRSKEDCTSFLGLDSIASFQVKSGLIQRQLPNGKNITEQVDSPQKVSQVMNEFIGGFDINYEQPYNGFNGFFGHTNFDAVQYFDTLTFDSEKRKTDIPDIRYTLYRFVISINHFKDELIVIENIPEGEESQIEKLELLLKNQKVGTYQFRIKGEESSNLTDDQFKDLVTAGKHHCQIGDVFQIVFSRQFSQSFQGDDFNVYRTLRSINPSPYLFYFDYGDYKIFGSSPESQMVIKGDIARVNPIAGTYKRTGDLEEDAQRGIDLSKDVKENAEHIMLVDLARNDLSRNTTNVTVDKYKEVQYFSHVIHPVSKVTGKLQQDAKSFQIYADTFPAGTLSGAPKIKAMELIDQYEPDGRTFYGGGLGLIHFNGDLNHAIVIRSFLSQDGVLTRQAGAGIVIKSDEQSELQEVNNKLAALQKAIQLAEKIK